MYEYLWLFIDTAFHLTKVSQIWMSIIVRTLLLLEETPSGETGGNLVGSVCVLKSGISESFSCISQSIAGPEGQIDEVNYIVQHPAGR